MESGKLFFFQLLPIDLMTKVIDCHVHSRGGEEASRIVSEMDESGIDAIVLFSPYPGQVIDEYSGEYFYNIGMQKEAALHVAKLQKEYPDRIIGFLWLEPRLEGAAEVLEWALTDLELKGVKMIPYHWHPYDENLFNVYEKIEELEAPVIFHSGILFGFEDSSRFCRPVNFEVLIKFPKLRFALAHVGWPWVDECIALWGRFRHAAWKSGGRTQMFIDATPGTPLIYRREVFAKVLGYGAHDYLLFGSDSSTRSLKYSKSVRETDERILRDELGMPGEVVIKYLGLNAIRFLGLK